MRVVILPTPHSRVSSYQYCTNTCQILLISVSRQKYQDKNRVIHYLWSYNYSICSIRVVCRQPSLFIFGIDLHLHQPECIPVVRHSPFLKHYTSIQTQH